MPEQEELFDQDDKYWDIDRTATHNCLFNFIVGNRGGGKSFGGKWLAIKKFIRKGEQFVYVRRHDEDLKEPLRTFFNDMYIKYPDYECLVESNKVYIRKKEYDEEGNIIDKKWTEEDLAGYGIQLSTANKKKSIAYPKVTTIIVDEFLLKETSNQRYLSDEAILFLELYETIARPGTEHPDVTVWFLGNAISITNPYFVYFNLKIPMKKDKNGKRIWKHPDGEILVEFVRNYKFVEAKRKTRYAKIIKGTKYEDYSIENEFLLDENTFIERRSQKAKHNFNFSYKGSTYGVWIDYQESKMWVSDAVDPSGVTFSLTTQDHNTNTILLKNRNNSYFLKQFFEFFKSGCLRFETMNIKNNCYDIFNAAW